MTYPQALLLALVQALTEFLPVSSSGHLVLAQRIMGGVGEVELLYDVLLHFATALAIIAYFRRDLVGLLRGLVAPGAGSPGPFRGHERRILGYIALASVPTALVGLGIERTLTRVVTRADVVGLMLMITGVILWSGRGRTPQRTAGGMGAVDALTIGVVQGLAVLPGISRSGSTITTGILRGLDRDLAARFSLLVSVPAILGATLLKALEALDDPLPPWGPFLAGMLTAAVVGYGAIGLILWMVRADRFHLFALYLWPLGALAILWYHLA